MASDALAPPPSDPTRQGREAWRRAKEGDANAREWIRLRTTEIALPLLKWKRVPRDEVESVMQEVHAGVEMCVRNPSHWVENFEKFIKGRARGAFSKWLAANVRTRLERSSLERADELGAVRADDGSPWKAIESSELRAAIRDCREGLTGMEERAIRDRYDLELEYAAIAAHERVDVAAIRLRVFRALRKLRPCLERRLGLNLD